MLRAHVCFSFAFRLDCMLHALFFSVFRLRLPYHDRFDFVLPNHMHYRSVLLHFCCSSNPYPTMPVLIGSFYFFCCSPRPSSPFTSFVRTSSSRTVLPLLYHLFMMLFVFFFSFFDVYSCSPVRAHPHDRSTLSKHSSLRTSQLARVT